jgi:hypothetical protein
MPNTERRHRRSDCHSQALYYQLDACRERAMLEAMILADENGLCLAASGEPSICEEFAVHAAMVCEDTASFAGTVLSPARRWDVSMQRFEIEGVPLYLCAIGGEMNERAQEIDRSMGGVSRILA